VKLEAVEIVRVAMPLVTPFRTSFGTTTTREVVLLRAVTDQGEGWGEAAVHAEPFYNEEFVDAALIVLERFLVPMLCELDHLTAEAVRPALRLVKGYPAAKAGLEMAIFDAELRAQGISASHALGGVRTRVPVGVSVGISPNLGHLVDTVERYVEAGYARVKLKIEPGADLEPVAAVRERFSDLALQVDANAAYGPGDHAHLLGLDTFDLVMLEQPFAREDLAAHATLARELRTPICLDESITSADLAAQAIELEACAIVNIKVGRVGGLLSAKAVHDRCQDLGVPVWCGGMLESGIGRAANVALASLPGFTYPGDLSGSDRYFHQDVTEPFVVEDSHLAVPEGPGLGVTVRPEVLDELGAERHLVRPS